MGKLKGFFQKKLKESLPKSQGFANSELEFMAEKRKKPVNYIVSFSQRE